MGVNTLIILNVECKAINDTDLLIYTYTLILMQHNIHKEDSLTLVLPLLSVLIYCFLRN